MESASLLARRRQFASARRPASHDLERDEGEAKAIVFGAGEKGVAASITPTAHGVHIATSKDGGVGAVNHPLPILRLDGCRLEIGGVPGVQTSASIRTYDSSNRLRSLEMGLSGEVVADVPSVLLRDVAAVSFAGDSAHLRPAADIDIRVARPSPASATVPGDLLSRRTVRVCRGATTFAETWREEVRQEGRREGRPEARWSLFACGSSSPSFGVGAEDVHIGAAGLPLTLLLHARRSGADCATTFTPSGDVSLAGDLSVKGGNVDIHGAHGSPASVALHNNLSRVSWKSCEGETFAALVGTRGDEGESLRASAGASSLSVLSAGGVEIEGAVRSMSSSLLAVRNRPDTCAAGTVEMMFDRRGRLTVTDAVHSVSGGLLLGRRKEVSGLSHAARVACDPASRELLLDCTMPSGRCPSLSLGDEVKLCVSGPTDVALRVDGGDASLARNLCLGGKWLVTHLAKPFEDHHAASLGWVKDYVSRTAVSRDWLQGTALSGMASRDWVEAFGNANYVTSTALEQQVLSRMVVRDDLAACLAEMRALLPPPSSSSPSPATPARRVAVVRGGKDLSMRPFDIAADVATVVISAAEGGDGSESVSLHLPRLASVPDGHAIEIVAVGKDVRVDVFHEAGEVRFLGRDVSPEMCSFASVVSAVRLVACKELSAWVRM